MMLQRKFPKYVWRFLIKLFSVWELWNIYIIFFRYADQVAIGDEVLVLENDDLTPTKVINVSSFNMQGTH